MQEEPVHPTLQAQPAPELARAVIAHLTTISQNHVGPSSNTNPTIASTTNLDLLLPPFPKSERATTTATPPPEYEECVGILPVVLAKGNLSTGAALEPMVITRLERLEAGQNWIEAAILGMQQQLQTCNQTSSGRRSLRLFCPRFRSALVKGTRLSPLEVDNNPAHRERVMTEVAEARREAAEARREADRCEEIARCMLECLKNGTDFEESMAYKLVLSDLPK
ncbi:hypothetical protein DL770_003911 [Monosporascus sp. CRB-9-2]|nr:hypothetical protein DL770_003911 [Monosporascus sp. CRB-9-2]